MGLDSNLKLCLCDIKTYPYQVNETPKALSDLYRFLSFQVIHILDVVNRKYLSYRVDLDHDDNVSYKAPGNNVTSKSGLRFLTIAQLKDLICQDTNIPPSQQVWQGVKDPRE